MEIEYWWLLALPLFFVLGWLAARIDIKHLLTESRALPRSYFKGLNFLLNEDVTRVESRLRLHPNAVSSSAAAGGTPPPLCLDGREGERGRRASARE